MGKELFCDFCRGPVPIEQSFQSMKINDRLIGEACLNCATMFERTLKQQISSMAAQHAAAVIAAKQQAAAAPTAQPPAEALK